MYRQCSPNTSSMMGGWFIYLIIGVAILALIILLFTKLMGQKTTSSKSTANTALTILQERYAKGEIDESEYVSKKKILLDE